MGAPTSGSQLRRALSAALAIAVVVVVFAIALPKIANYGDVWNTITAMTGWQVSILALGTLWNLVTFGPTWMAALPRLTYRQSIELTMAGTAVANIAPAGGPVSLGITWAMLREWGFERRAVTMAMVLTGIWNQVLNVGTPLVALALLALSGQRNLALERAAILGVVVLLVALGVLASILKSDRLARWWGGRADQVVTPIRRRFGKGALFGSGVALARFRHDSLHLLKRRSLALTLTTAVGVMANYLVLYAALRILGAKADQVTGIEVFAAWSFVRLLTAIPITPGGLGIIEIGLTGLLTGFGGAEAPVVGAVLLYRALTFVPPILCGLVAALTWQRHQKRRVLAS